MSTVTDLLHGKNNNGASHKKQVLGKEIFYNLIKYMILKDKKFQVALKKSSSDQDSSEQLPRLLRLHIV